MSLNISRSDLRRIVVAIDPAVSANEDSDDTGIVVVGRGPHQPSTCKLEGLATCPGHGYVLDDLTCHVTPREWAQIAVQGYDDWHADRIVAEVNNGGDMVGTTIHAVRAGISYEAVRASRGKQTRAEPVSALYEQGRVHHLGVFPELEMQLTTWTPDSDSPDRLDALVWGLTALGLVGAEGHAWLSAWKEMGRRDVAKRGRVKPIEGVDGHPEPTEKPTPAQIAIAKEIERKNRSRKANVLREEARTSVCEHFFGPMFADGTRACQKCPTRI
jgi:hypothetical protein